MAHRSRSIGAGAIALATGILIALPTFSTGATVKNDLRSFAPAPRAVHLTQTPKTEPPLHGTNPHGQGTAAAVNLNPSATRPYNVDAEGNADDEDIVIGRSRGEQRADGSYHGHVTVAALFGNEVIAGADTQAGDAAVDEGVAKSLLDALCNGSGICLDVVHVKSNTTATGSTNSFSLASLALGGAVPLPNVPGVVPALRLGVAESVGNITSDSACQTANGSSRVADLTAGTAVAKVAQSSSQSRACRGETPTVTNTSSVIDLGGTGVGIPSAGCANGTPDTAGGLLPPLLETVCNADDASPTGGTQADPAATPSAYGVRNALDVWVLNTIAQVSTAQSESRAVAPAAVTTTTTPTTTTPTTTTPTTTTATTTPTTATTTATPTAATPGVADDTGDTGDTGDESGNEGAGDAGAGAGTPECSDGVDNDGDGKVDFGNDPGCSSAADDSEDNGAVNLGGKELPFTGTDVVVLGLAGSLLLAAGLTLRGPARRREELDV